jgi:hypothetical protein
MSLSAKFNELETILLEQRHLLGLHTGVPFIILVYDPHDERFCQARQFELREKLEVRGVQVVACELSNFIFDYYAGKGQLERIFDLDRDPKYRQDLQQMIAGIYEKELVERIQTGIKNSDPDNSVIFLTGVASMYPFARVSNLLTALENLIKVPLVVFYPGREQDGKLSFLNQEPHIGYRARRI